MSELSLKEGAYYTDRQGNLVGPMVRIAPAGHRSSWFGWESWEFQCGDTFYHANGQTHMHKSKRLGDLVSEVILIENEELECPSGRKIQTNSQWDSSFLKRIGRFLGLFRI